MPKKSTKSARATTVKPSLRTQVKKPRISQLERLRAKTAKMRLKARARLEKTKATLKTVRAGRTAAKKEARTNARIAKRLTKALNRISKTLKTLKAA